MQIQRTYPQLLLLALSPALLPSPAGAADEFRNSVEAGIGYAVFPVDSGDLQGPPGSTPPGVRAKIDDAPILPLIYQRRLDDAWSLVLQAGLPPNLDLRAAGTASALGIVGSSRAWFPGLMASYRFQLARPFSVHAGAGVHYTFFTDGEVRDNYTRAFGGTASSVKLDPAFGPLVKLGATWAIDERWYVDFSYNHYWLKTRGTIKTVTPGLGEIERKIDIKAEPTIVALTLGYRF